MKPILKYILSSFFLFFLLAGKNAEAQVSASVDLSRSSVYVQQPFRVNITVYTQTWFTAPLEFINLQIPNAFIVPFDKTQPGMFTVGGKQYPGIQFYYIVFPYKTGEFSVPSLEITAQSPPEGSSTSRKIVIHTAEQKFTVKDIPQSAKNGTWFVAEDITLTEKWNVGLDNLKVGDVIERTITIDAQETLPQFIPNIAEQQQTNWASIYPKDPILSDSKASGDVNGQSLQKTTYLLEKSGNVTLPAIHLSFWNPYTSKMQERILPEKTLHIKENANLGILTTLRDSLAGANQGKNPNTAKIPFLIWGFTWYEFTGIVIMGLGMLYLIVHFGIRFYKKWKVRRKAYKQSEKYLFSQFLKSDDKHIITALYKWWDVLENRPSASVRFSMLNLKTESDENLLKTYIEKYFKDEKTSDIIIFKKTIQNLRKQILNTSQVSKVINEEQRVW